MVCRRWYDCMHSSSELCGELVATGALGSLTRWLRRHGQHVHTLRLFVLGEEGYLNFEEGMLLGCCLATCSGLARLQRLTMTAAAWQLQRRGLRRCAACGSCR